MSRRIPMVGDPKPLDREALARSLEESVPRMHADAVRLFAEVEAGGDKAEIKAARATVQRAQALLDDLEARRGR